MNILLSGEFEAAGLHEWRLCLCAALPEARWLDRDEALDVSDTVEAAVVANPPPGSLSGLPKLRLIQSLWAGVDGLLQDPTLPPGVPIARMVDPAMNAAMAETALWATLSLHRGFFDYARAQRDGRWHPQPQQRADESPVLVLGLGQMGLTSARRLARQGYPVRGWSLGLRGTDTDGIDCRHGRDALPGLLAASRIVINLLPLTPATAGLLDARFFAALPRGAAIVNLARGAHLVDADLLAALDRGQLSHAVLDVFRSEPLPAGHAFWTHPQVTVLPHVAAQTDPRSAAQVVAANLRRCFSGATPEHLVDRSRGY
jgi:glyoxylate/hydroxypyruvate reductase A